MKRYVVYMPDLDYFYYPYNDLFLREDIQVIKFQYPVPLKRSSKFLRKFSCIWFSERNMEKKTHIPFRTWWYHNCKVIPDSTDEIVFCFGELFTLCTPQYRRYLKKHFPNCKIVYTMFDLAKWWVDQTNDMETIKQFADVVFSYDKDDCKKYGFVFHRDAYSVLPEDVISGNQIHSDLNFCGKAKDRYKEILEVYDSAKNAGVICDFNIVKLPQKEKEVYPELAESRYIPYIEYIRRIQGANCLFEICQDGKNQYTLRPWEAIAYGKKILTNNKEFLNEEFYDPEYIQVYDKPETIDWEWVKKKVSVDYKYIEKLSVNKLLEDYDRVLDGIHQ